MHRDDVGSQPRVVKVSRALWIRGTGPVSMLYDDIGHMNIGGFVGRSLGISGSDMMHMYTPSDDALWPLAFRKLYDAIWLINDSQDLTEPGRETLLVYLLGQIDLQVEFGE